MCIMASGIARGRVRTTTTTATATVVESRNMAAIFSKRDFQRKKPHPYQQTIAEVDLTFLIRVARIYSQRSSEK